MGYTFRCNCPITSALDILGDKWMLVIIKQMLMEGKQTFKDFVESEEGIATNILSSKLKLLEQMGMITKTKLPNNRKINLYCLTEKGIALMPVIVELAIWSDNYLRDLHPSIVDGEDMELLRRDKEAFANILERKYREKLERLRV
jgi:DNA-binding HxlR family transcriptional regulator